MEVQTNGAEPGAANLVPEVTDSPISDGDAISPREAATRYAQRRDEQNKPPQNRAPDGKFASSQAQDTAPEADAAPPQEATGETQEIDPAETPPLDPPRSWSKDDHERWSKLDRDTQQYLLDRDGRDSAAVRKAQNEAADIRKAAEAERTQAEQARQKYEAQVAEMLQALQQQGDFADIKTDADVQKLATEDPFRFVQWQARQQQINGLQQKARELQEQRMNEARDAFVKWAEDQDKAFLAEAKEFADPDKGEAARKDIAAYLTEVRGIPQDRLQRLYSGMEMFSIRSSEAQLIIRDAARWHAAQKKAVAAAQKPVPPVQRPGTAPSKADANAATVKALEQKVDQATTLRGQLQAAAALRAAKRAQ